MSQQKEYGNRVLYLDFLRVISVLFMMLLHVAARDWYELPVNGSAWQIHNIYDSLARFCVPVLFMISGAFLLNPRKEYPLKKLFFHNILRIVTAFIFWSFCYALVSTYQEGVFGITAIIKRTVIGHYHLWFLFAIAGLYLITPFLRKFICDKNLCIYFLILFFLFGILIHFLMNNYASMAPLKIIVEEKMNFYFVLGYTGYFVAGYYLYTYGVSKKMEKAIYVLGVIGIISTILLTYYFSNQSGIATGTFYDNFSPNVFLASIAVFTLFRQRISKLKFSPFMGKTISVLSKCAFGMYLVHDFFIMIFDAIGLTHLTTNSLFIIPLTTICVFVCSFLTIYPISKLPFLNKYII